ncbi:MAG: hypothetical protein KBD01_16020 [Acidobacteria bacterium]|nr:hypothetical protein [Acidobacteriota bacterium]
MSRTDNAVLPFIVATLFSCVLPASAGQFDVLVLRDGSELTGRLLELDAQRAVFELEGGARETIARTQIRRVEFGDVAAAPLKVRVQVIEADDEVRLYLDGAEIAPAAELKGGPFDLAPLLKEGPNRITAEALNQAGPWAYRWMLEAGGRKHVFACGLAGKSGCTKGGDARQKGVMPAGGAWVFVHRETGEVTVTVD